MTYEEAVLMVSSGEGDRGEVYEHVCVLCACPCVCARSHMRDCVCPTLLAVSTDGSWPAVQDFTPVFSLHPQLPSEWRQDPV